MKLLGKEETVELIKNFKGEFFYVKPEDFPDFSENFSEKVQEVSYKIKKSETGAILLMGEENLLIIPPFPVEKTFRGGNDYFFELMKKKFTLGIILLRLGEYSLGIFKENKLVVHKTGTQFVEGKIKAGGQSAARYARIREGQINDFFKKVCFHVREKFEHYSIDYVFFGGDKQTVKSFLKNCEYLKKFRVMKRVLNVRHMKLKSLEDSLKEVWKFKVYSIE